ncbi:MAG: deaminase [Candidatus Peregrinibacteria bacterium]|nr:deaminase [Candidatus Peregrinibacteria bacterium]
MFPYLPKNREILFVPTDNPFMQVARQTAETKSLDLDHKTGAVIVKNNEIIGRGANGSLHHTHNGCDRKKLGSKTGEDYDLCEGCSPKNHAEPQSILDAQKNKKPTTNADLYLWGHWWCCESCWKHMIKAKIKNVYLAEGSKEMFGE